MNINLKEQRAYQVLTIFMSIIFSLFFQQSTAQASKGVHMSGIGTFKYCPDIRILAAEVLEYEVRGFDFLYGQSTCRDRSIFKYFNTGDEDPVADSNDSETIDEQISEVIVVNSKKPYEIVKINRIDNENYEVVFNVFTKEKNGSLKKIQSKLGFAVMDTPKAINSDIGCIEYTAPPTKTFIRNDCIDGNMLKHIKKVTK